ncbi:MAG TPA: hypothetical protein VLI45_10660 [Acidobacteriaceae bacterium]|nr:hypothetical protein [Acidobacteriaceae bacterium]
MISHASQRAANSDRIAAEEQSQWLVTAFIASGMIFMLLPGTFLGVWNLIDISREQTLGSLSSAWLQAHGQAQLFGWVGSFILGIGFYSLTKIQSTLTFPARSGWAAWVLWTLGITLRWTAGVAAWHWKILMPLSAVLELAAFVLFYRSVRRHGPKSSAAGAKETWMLLVAGGTIAFLLALIVNLGAVIFVAARSDTPALPHVFDQQLILLMVWGVLVPTIWGFNARWLPIFGGLKKPDSNHLRCAYGLSIVGLAIVFLQWWAASAALLLFVAFLVVEALHVWEPAVQPAKLQGVHASFPYFLRIPYVWLVISCVLNAMAVRLDQSGGIWGASRHAITVGFVAGMVFVIGQRLLPAFCGMRTLWSPKLMLWSLLALHVGCALRVTLEPLAYEGYWRFAWRILPYSALVELAAVTLFAWNIFATLLQPPAHLGVAASQPIRGATASLTQ